jgi:hypothetical protein
MQFPSFEDARYEVSWQEVSSYTFSLKRDISYYIDNLKNESTYTALTTQLSVLPN